MSSLRIPCRGVVSVAMPISYLVRNGRETGHMVPVSQLDQVGRPPQSLWDRILAEPDRAPEHIALAAAERFGPAAAEWVRVAGGGQTPEKLARIAYRKHVRLARLEGGALGVGGIFTAAPDLVALLWIQSRMVFYIAAALRVRPAPPDAPRRAAGAARPLRHARGCPQGPRRHGQAPGTGGCRAGAALGRPDRPPPQARQVPGQAADAALRGPADTPDRRADRRAPERRRPPSDSGSARLRTTAAQARP